MRPLLILVSVLVLTACGSGGGEPGSAAAPTTETVTRYHASGRVEETGAIVTATGKRTGTWTAYHDADGSPLRFSGSYSDDRLDLGKPWSEWNVDGSVRADSRDR